MLKTFSITDVGRKRQMNQDSVFSSEVAIGNLPNLFIVADGMGGHKAGDYASKCTVDTMKEMVARSLEKDPAIILREAIEEANRRIHAKSGEDAEYEGMGTTVVAATILGNILQIANVGDSRLYIINEEITQVTKDHSLVEEMIRMGGLDRDAARTHPDKNIITRAVGVSEQVLVDFFTVELTKQDTILLCSDGLTNMLDDEEILMIVRGQRDVVEKAQQLVHMANERGGRDNISVVLLEVSEL
ncbi:MAG: Stp1/IreP family PP2C-type Ser/Thr phosphatase [Lachnospiraceae bacterium]|nr:Stp1/IreP family PP2C-type Ser/Thr phosphatase [Lachnospiraceae bacterium]